MCPWATRLRNLEGLSLFDHRSNQRVKICLVLNADISSSQDLLPVSVHHVFSIKLVNQNLKILAELL